MAKFEIYFFGLICFVTNDPERPNVTTAEIVLNEDHCPYLYAPVIRQKMMISGDLSVARSLPAANPTPASEITHLKAHVSKSTGTATLEPTRKVYRFPLPDGDFSVCQHFANDGQFNGAGPNYEIPRVTLLTAAQDISGNVTLDMGSGKVADIPADSWLLIANVGAMHDCKLGSHFAMFKPITTADQIDELCDGAKVAHQPKETSHFKEVKKVIDKPDVPCKHPHGFDTTQVDCSSSQWP